MAESKFPESYRDPAYAALDTATEQKLGLPVGMLSNIRTNGERSNNSQVSEAAAKSPYQFIPATRDAIIKKYGIDPLLSPENASEAAGLLLKEGLKRNNGDESQAIGEYIGGTNRANWGKTTNAYIARVMGGMQRQKTDVLSNDFAKWMAANPAVPAEKPQAAAAAPTAPSALEEGFGKWFAAEGPKAGVREPEAPQEPGIMSRIGEAITGNQRATEETKGLPDWASMPELNSFSMASAKTGLGTLLSNPEETVKVIQSNFPGVQVSQDPKGNFLLTSSIDGKQYAIKPGFQVSDIPRAAGALAAFTPAGRAVTLPGMAAGAGATQAVLEATQAATGGEFNPGEVVTAAALAPMIPAAVNAVRAVGGPARQAINRVMGHAERAAPTAPLASAENAAARPVAVTEPRPPVAETGASLAAPEAVPTAAQPRPSIAPAEMGAEEMTQTAKTAAQGGMGSTAATDALAAQAAPNPKTLEAAKRLGIEDYLQPDHITTSQTYRELAQAVKSIPGSEARAAELQGLEKIGQRAEKLIEDIGGSSDLSQISHDVAQAQRGRIEGLAEKEALLYGRVRAGIPNRTPAEAKNTLAFIESRANDLGGVENLSPMEKAVWKRLSTDEFGAKPTYALLDDVRKDVGAVTARGGPFADADIGLAKQVYGRLAQDQLSVAESTGKKWDYLAAQYATKLRKSVEDDMVSLFGKEIDKSLTPALSGAIRALPRGDEAKLIKLLDSIPGDMRQEVVASGLATAFRTAGTRGPISFSQFEKWYEGLLANKRAHAALMSNLPISARKQVSDLYRVSKGISSASRERITTGRIMAVQEQLKPADNLAGKLYDAAKRGALGATVGTAAGAVLGPGAGAAIASALTKGAKPAANKAVDALIASPEFIAATRAAPGTMAQKSAIKRFARLPEFGRFIRAIGGPREMGDKERWILAALQGSNQVDTEK